MTVSAPDYVAERGYAFLTLSILINGDDINALAESCEGGPRIWQSKNLGELAKDYAETRALQRAIVPMFDDIADRERNLFIKDFLLDTPNPSSGKDDLRRNVCADIGLMLPRNLHWTTEGIFSRIDLDASIEFKNVLCRAFWMVHSNDALSYHLSFEVPYERSIPDFYGLSMLLKAFQPTEGTDWVVDLSEKGRAFDFDAPAPMPKAPETQGWMAIEAAGGRYHLLAFIESLFEAHCADLFGQLAKRKWIKQEVATKMAASAWQRLVLHDAQVSPDDSTPLSWHQGARRRLLVVMRDQSMFEVINRVREDVELVRTLEPLRSNDTPHTVGTLQAHFEEQSRALADRPGAAKEALNATQLAAVVFLSGFFQNIVDFLEQDDLEVHDGISPLYPDPGDANSNDGYFVYATPRFMFEVVGTSRSLDRAGRRWLGTCPYVFLVHVMALHNEGIVHTYEKSVSELVDELDRLGIHSRAFSDRTSSTMPLGKAFERINAFRLRTFEQVHKHLSFNVFRYDTEQAFFNRVQHVRGTAARQEYWDRVLEHLTRTVDALKEHRLAVNGLRLAWFGFLLALSGGLQVWFAIYPGSIALSPGADEYQNAKSLALAFLCSLLAIKIFLRKTQRWFEGHDDAPEAWATLAKDEETSPTASGIKKKALRFRARPSS